MRLPSLSALVLLLANAAAAQSVHVVDLANGPGTDFTSLVTAVNAAVSGDVLLVRAGEYPESLVLGSKSLTVTAEVGATVRVHGISVSGLPSGETIVVRGFDARDNVVPGISCTNSAGSIWLEECGVLAFPTFFGPAGGATVTDCESVVLSGCTITGPQRIGMSNDTFLSTRSRVFLYDSLVEGGSFDRFDGWTGMIVTDGTVFLAGSTVRGGAGQDGVFTECHGGDGGVGVRLLGTAPSVHAQDSQVAGGNFGTGTCGDGVFGQGVVVDAGLFHTSSTLARPFSTVSPARDDESFSGTYRGRPGDRVWLMYSLEPSAGTTAGVIDGRLLLRAPRFRLFRGEIGAGDILVDSVPLNDIGPGVEALRVFAQPLHLNSSVGEAVLGSPRAIVVLDSAF